MMSGFITIITSNIHAAVVLDRIDISHFVWWTEVIQGQYGQRSAKVITNLIIINQKLVQTKGGNLTPV